MTTIEAEAKIPADSATPVSTENTGLKAGLITLIALITYFLIIKYFSIMHSPVAWAFNFLILGGGIICAFEYYRSKTTLNVDYIPGLILGSIITFVSVIPFSVFIYIILSQSDKAWLSSLKNNVLFMGDPTTAVKVAFTTAIEGLCSGVLITFLMMQYLRSGFRRMKNEKLKHG